mmetsp:Transcript_22360/g.44287  ORF Transcript_22360/g.44287 Transcript_22360/m.44287 type:complete len:166 (+) Transcript_22360:72-569(+)
MSPQSSSLLLLDKSGSLLLPQFFPVNRSLRQADTMENLPILFSFNNFLCTLSSLLPFFLSTKLQMMEPEKKGKNKKRTRKYSQVASLSIHRSIYRSEPFPFLLSQTDRAPFSPHLLPLLALAGLSLMRSSFLLCFQGSTLIDSLLSGERGAFDLLPSFLPAGLGV